MRKEKWNDLKHKFWPKFASLPSHFSPTADITHQSQQSLSQHSSHLSTHMDESLHAHTHVNTNARTPTRITLICYLASEVLSTHPRAPTQTPFYLLVLKYFQLSKHNRQRRAIVHAKGLPIKPRYMMQEVYLKSQFWKWHVNLFLNASIYFLIKKQTNKQKKKQCFKRLTTGENWFCLVWL